MSALRAWLALCLGLGACAPAPADKLGALGLSPESQTALARLRFSALQTGDRVDAEDLILCGERDRALVGFSKKQVTAYLGLDAEWLVPELFELRGNEARLAVPPRQLARIRLPRGIGSTGNPPAGWVREVAGYPQVSRDVGALLAAFGDDEELFAVRREATAAVALPAPVPSGPRRLGVTVFPRMGPQAGVMIADVEPRSPAAAAGLGRGDRIVSLDGRPLKSFSELRGAIAEAPSSRVRLEILKKSAKLPIELELDLATDGSPASGE